MSPERRALSLLVLALEELRLIYSTDENVYVRCPWTRWHEGLPIKYARVAPDPQNPENLRARVRDLPPEALERGVRVPSDERVDARPRTPERSHPASCDEPDEAGS